MKVERQSARFPNVSDSRPSTIDSRPSPTRQDLPPRESREWERTAVRLGRGSRKRAASGLAGKRPAVRHRASLPKASLREIRMCRSSRAAAWARRRSTSRNPQACRRSLPRRTAQNNRGCRRSWGPSIRWVPNRSRVLSTREPRNSRVRRNSSSASYNRPARRSRTRTTACACLPRSSSRCGRRTG